MLSIARLRIFIEHIKLVIIRRILYMHKRKITPDTFCWTAQIHVIDPNSFSLEYF